MAADLTLSQLLGAALLVLGLLLAVFLAWAAWNAYQERRADADMAYQWDQALAEIATRPMPEYDGETWGLEPAEAPTATWQSEWQSEPVPPSAVSGPLPRLSPSRDTDDFIRSMTTRTDALIAMLAEPVLCGGSLVC